MALDPIHVPRTRAEPRPRSLHWPLLLVLAVVLLTPVALIAPTFVSPQNAINTVVGGKRLFMGRTRGGAVAPPGVTPLVVKGSVCLLFRTGTSEKYVFYFGEGTVTPNADGTLSILL